jgi:hypothetical protein
MLRILMISVLVTTSVITDALVHAQQPAAEPRRIYFDSRPIVDLIRPGDRHLVLALPPAPPAFGDCGNKSCVAAILDENPIVFAGRLVQKEPAFLTLRDLDYTLTSMDQANWIGSRITMRIDWGIQTMDTFPLAAGDRLTFIDDGDGSAMVNGVRVDTETPWLWPTESGRRYLITARIKRDQFMTTGMWMEPAAGGSMRSNASRAGRTPGDLRPARSPMPTPFDDWTIEQATFFLEQEVQRRGTGRR